MNYKLHYSGSNFLSLLNFLERYGLSIAKVKYGKDGNVDFEMTPHDYKMFKSKNKVFKVSIIKDGGIKRVVKSLYCRAGLIVGLVAIMIVSIIFGNITVDVKVIGNHMVKQSEIKNAIIDYGYQFGKSTTFDKEKMEHYLLENIEELSLVSVAKKGNMLMVSVVEKTETPKENYPFCAPYNMVVKSIDLISGTPLVKAGDIVKKGDVLVDNYVVNADGEKINIEANAHIVAEVYFCDNIVVEKQMEIFEKTGEKTIYNLISFLKAKTPLYDNNYEYSDINISHNVLLNNMFLPIYYNKVVVWELRKVLKTFDYDNNSEKYFEQSLKNAYALVPDGVIINDEISKVTECEDKYIFQTYLKSEMGFSNDN